MTPICSQGLAISQVASHLTPKKSMHVCYNTPIRFRKSLLHHTLASKEDVSLQLGAQEYQQDCGPGRHQYPKRRLFPQGMDKSKLDERTPPSSVMHKSHKQDRVFQTNVQQDSPCYRFKSWILLQCHELRFAIITTVVAHVKNAQSASVVRLLGTQVLMLKVSIPIRSQQQPPQARLSSQMLSTCHSIGMQTESGVVKSWAAPRMNGATAREAT
jgi:hypothetical protein